MINKLIGIFLTILIGLFFLVGIVICKNTRNKEKTALFTTALAFVVMFGLLVFDLFPEIMEAQNIFLIIPGIIGFFLLIFLDFLIPHHHHDHQEENDNLQEHQDHLNHIGTITIIALAIHNLLEGLTLYTVTLSSIKSGVLMMISISLHNIPLGFQIGNALESKKNHQLLLSILCLSSFLGSLIIIFFGTFNEILSSIFLALTFGMLLYILIFELFNEIRKQILKKEVIYGIMLGVIILVITFLV